MTSSTQLKLVTLTPEDYREYLLSGQPLPPNMGGLLGRLIKGRAPGDFLTLTDDPKRLVVNLLDMDGLAQLPGRSGYEMLINIGYTEDHIVEEVERKGKKFKLVIFPEGPAAMPATWENLISIASNAYPLVAAKLEAQLQALKNTSYKEIQLMAGCNFEEVDKLGSSDPRFMTYDKLQRAAGTLPDVRAFLHHTCHQRELFSGDGYVWDKNGKRGAREYIAPNLPIAQLGEHVLIDIAVEIPTTKKGVSTVTRTTGMHSANQAAGAAYELPLPDFYDPEKVKDWKWTVDYKARFGDALALAKAHKIRASANDDLRIALMPIDNQLTFCHPDFELYVGGRSGTGAIDDTRRLTEFGHRNLAVITTIFPTLDTHTAHQIFHPSFLVNEKGEHPDPRFPTMITLDEIESGKWRIDPKVAAAATGNAANYAALQAHLLAYAKKLAQGGKYALTIWPFHAMAGSQGHALMPSLQEMIFAHDIARGSGNKLMFKGGNPLTENYSVLRPEVLTNASGKAIAQKNTDFLKLLLDHDMVIIAGQAKSHCVAWTIQDLLDEIMVQDPDLVKKVYLLEDCTSAVVVPGVVDFTDQADEAFRKFAAAGMHVVQSTTPIAEWPGVDQSRLGR